MYGKRPGTVTMQFAQNVRKGSAGSCFPTPSASRRGLSLARHRDKPLPFFKKTERSDNLSVRPTGGALGAEIVGCDLAEPLTPAEVVRVRGALLDHGVVFFRRQQLSDEDLVRFTSFFGKPVPHVRKQRPRRVKEIFLISNIRENGEPIGELGDELIPFHSDLSYLRRPGTLSVLYALEIPSTGGQTQWCNCTAAYEELDADGEGAPERDAGRAPPLRRGAEPSRTRRPPGCAHPPGDGEAVALRRPSPDALRSRPRTGRRARTLLAGLYAHLEQPRFVWTHEWQVGDVVLFDNRPTMHRRLPFPPDQRRLMKRTQVFNDEIPVE